MKKLLNRKWIKNLCNLCLAFSTVLAANLISVIIYGEPEYPTEE